MHIFKCKALSVKIIIPCLENMRERSQVHEKISIPPEKSGAAKEDGNASERIEHNGWFEIQMCLI